MTESILDNISIDVEEAERTALSLQSAELQPIGAAFARNVDTLLGLASFPLVLLSVGATGVQQLVLFTQALVRTKNVQRWGKSEAATAEVEAEVKKLWEESAQDPDSPFRPVEQAKTQLARLLELPDVNCSAIALLFACVSYAWATFECVAKDAWIAAVNSRPIQLGHPALIGLRDERAEEGLSGKHISIGMLARHGFDLRDKLGTLAAGKFDFTSVSGIRAAYSAAFGKRTELEEPLANPNLAVLEATRHVVVHRAGLVDEEYLRRTVDGTPVGKQLPLDGGRVSALANSGVSAACGLLCAVDLWLQSNRPIEGQK